MIQSSVWIATFTPAFSSTAPFSSRKSAASCFPPGASMTMIDGGTFRRAISSATLYASVTCWSTRSKPNSSASPSAVRMSSARWVWKWTVRLAVGLPLRPAVLGLHEDLALQSAAGAVARLTIPNLR